MAMSLRRKAVLGLALAGSILAVCFILPSSPRVGGAELVLDHFTTTNVCVIVSVDGTPRKWVGGKIVTVRFDFQKPNTQPLEIGTLVRGNMTFVSCAPLLSNPTGQRFEADRVIVTVYEQTEHFGFLTKRKLESQTFTRGAVTP